MLQTAEYYDLGAYGRTITTRVPEAQSWFDRGLNWTYAYNHGEAIECFLKATEADPGCAMAWWGISYAAGPNYNLPCISTTRRGAPRRSAPPTTPCRRHRSGRMG